MLLSLQFLAGREGAGLLPLLLAIGKTALTALGLVVAARFLVPRFIGALAGTRQKEIFVVAVLFLVLGSALATSWAGLSAALGAFLAGLVLSESEYGHQAMADVAGFRDAFNAIFFVSIGMLFNPRILLSQPVLVAVLLGLILVWKTVAGGAAVLALGHGFRVALVVGISLAQIGDSLVLLRQGLAAELITQDVYQTFLAAAIITMLLTPFLSEISHAFAHRVTAGAGGAPSRTSSPAAAGVAVADHVIVIGFGHMGQTVARVLKRSSAPFRVIDLDPDRVKRGKKLGAPIEYGDSTNDTVLKRVGIEKARAAIVLLSDPRASRQTIRRCRALSANLFILARTRYLADIPALAREGANEVVAEEFETSLEIASRTLRHLGFPVPWVESEAAEIRSTRQDRFRQFRAPGADTE